MGAKNILNGNDAFFLKVMILKTYFSDTSIMHFFKNYHMIQKGS